MQNERGISNLSKAFAWEVERVGDLKVLEAGGFNEVAEERNEVGFRWRAKWSDWESTL